MGTGRAFLLRVKQLGREADHSPPAEAKEIVDLYIHSPTSSWRSAQFVKQRDNFTFTLPLKMTVVNEEELTFMPCCCEM
jgi:hypothetical protein